MLIPDELVKSSGLSESELLLELIVLLFQQEKITLAKASRLTGMTQIQFQRLLAERKIPVHYDIQDLHEDIANLKDVGLL
jgi:predicted HTH domain antitoxin